jgi:Tfp pilus assembly protein PilX
MLYPTVKKQNGFALLFTILVVSVLLAISLSISNITLRELVLSSATRDSHVAFYAADTALECALYIDAKKNALPVTGSPASISPVVPIPSCAKLDTQTATKVSFKNPDTSQYCFSFTVEKTTFTKIEARGYNTCTDSLRRVERGVRISYQ